jgi:hypothetical protein
MLRDSIKQYLQLFINYQQLQAPVHLYLYF